MVAPPMVLKARVNLAKVDLRTTKHKRQVANRTRKITDIIIITFTNSKLYQELTEVKNKVLNVSSPA